MPSICLEIKTLFLKVTLISPALSQLFSKTDQLMSVLNLYSIFHIHPPKLDCYEEQKLTVTRALLDGRQWMCTIHSQCLTSLFSPSIVLFSSNTKSSDLYFFPILWIFRVEN